MAETAETRAAAPAPSDAPARPPLVPPDREGPAAGRVPWPARLGAALRYHTSGRRDLRLDFLRGYCAVAMVVDHLGGASYLYPLTGGNTFFVSAAEGFIFLSGLLVGLIYGPRARRDGLAPAFDRLTPWMNTPVQVAVLLAILLLVKRRVLFEVVPS
jgi:uncharacterized membrane protein